MTISITEPETYRDACPRKSPDQAFVAVWGSHELAHELVGALLPAEVLALARMLASLGNRAAAEDWWSEVTRADQDIDPDTPLPLARGPVQGSSGDRDEQDEVVELTALITKLAVPEWAQNVSLDLTEVSSRLTTAQVAAALVEAGWHRDRTV